MFGCCSRSEGDEQEGAEGTANPLGSREKEISLSEQELQHLTGIFESIADAKTSLGQPALTPQALLHMTALLGEPHTEEETKDAIQHFHKPDGKTDEHLIDFSEFVNWWRFDHAGGHAGTQYAARFKFAVQVLHSTFELQRLSTVVGGEAGTLGWRMAFRLDDGDTATAKEISPWHQIPLYSDGRDCRHEIDAMVHFVCEIPRGTRKKFEVATDEVMNPIKQDTRNGALREYVYGDMPHNYGMIPQTWEDPAVVNEHTKAGGDNDPLDAIEIGSRVWSCGEVRRVKVLGVLALIDGGETDWKVVTLSEEDELFKSVSSCDDLEKARPGLLAEMREWFRVYKTAEDKPENAFAFEGEYKGPQFAHDVIQETHESWSGLMAKRQREVG